MLTNQSLWFDEGQSLLMTDSRTIAGTLLEMPLTLAATSTSRSTL